MSAKKSALGSRPNTFEKKLVGIVDVVVGETKAKFTLVEDGKMFAGNKSSITVLIDDLPAFPVLTPAHTGKQFRIRMNNAGDEVEALTPVTGHYTAKLIDLGKRDSKDADPTPYEKQDNFKGKEETSHLEFFAVYKIVKGAFKGVQMPVYYLHYKFEEDENGDTRYAFNTENPKATRGHQLVSWMDVHGLDRTPIKWDDVTILPELLERAADNDILVELIVKDGYIREVLPVQDEEEFVEVAPKAKRTEKELKAELGFEESTEETVDEVFAVVKEEKKAKKPAKKIVDEGL